MAMVAPPPVVVVAIASPPVVAPPAIVLPTPVVAAPSVLTLLVAGMTAVAPPTIVPIVVIDLRDVTCGHGAVRELRRRARRNSLGGLRRHDKKRK